jgi:hypothetical protein
MFVKHDMNNMSLETSWTWYILTMYELERREQHYYYSIDINTVFSFDTTAHIWALSSSVLRFLNHTQLDTR